MLVNQSPHMLDLLRWFMGDIATVIGSWANLNHPYIEVDDTAVAIIHFASGGLGAIVTSLSQKPGIYTKVHIHGSNGASVGVETDLSTYELGGESMLVELFLLGTAVRRYAKEPLDEPPLPIMRLR